MELVCAVMCEGTQGRERRRKRGRGRGREGEGGAEKAVQQIIPCCVHQQT